MKSTPQLKQMYAYLRSLGFKREWVYQDAVQYKATCIEEPTRVITVQFWFDDRHRVTHSISGRGVTYPSGFRSIQGLAKAVQFERERRDIRIVDHAISPFFD